MTFEEWLTIGVESRFCSEPECQTHNMVEMTEDEKAFFEDGGDPCVPVVRLWIEGAPEVGGPHIVPQEPQRENDALRLVEEAPNN